MDDVLSQFVGAPVTLGFGLLLIVHIAADLTCVITGAIAFRSRKARGRHPSVGEVYNWGLAIVFATATGMAVIRWDESAYLFVLGAIAFSLGSNAFIARKRRWHGWFTLHAAGMSLSYVVLLTALYVDNGPRLPIWNLLTGCRSGSDPRSSESRCLSSLCVGTGGLDQTCRSWCAMRLTGAQSDGVSVNRLARNHHVLADGCSARPQHANRANRHNRACDLSDDEERHRTQGRERLGQRSGQCDSGVSEARRRREEVRTGDVRTDRKRRHVGALATDQTKDDQEQTERSDNLAQPQSAACAYVG